MKVLREISALLVSVLLVSSPLSGQSGNATVSGTVADATGAVVPGVTVTATNNATGVVTTVQSNDAGVYNFASLQPGTYDIKAELPGFRTEIAKTFQLGGAQQARLHSADPSNVHPRSATKRCVVGSTTA